MPVLNEAAVVVPFLHNLRQCAPDAEIIVADGGSSDGTRELAEKICDRVISGAAGRAAQMNDGARVARGDILWFLHADCEAPVGCLEEIRCAIANPHTAGGYFRIRLPGTHAIYRLTDMFAHYAGIVLRIRCGDHGFFCRRETFFRAGGFPDVPLMEDVEFFRALRRLGRIAAVQRRMQISVRRYEQLGRTRVTFAYGAIATLYALGAPWPLLVSIYQRFCCAR